MSPVRACWLAHAARPSYSYARTFREAPGSLPHSPGREPRGCESLGVAHTQTASAGHAAIIPQANATDMTGGDSPLVPVGDWLAEVFRGLLGWASPVPEPVLGLALLGLAAAFVGVTLRDRRRATPADADRDESQETPGDESIAAGPVSPSHHPH